MVDSCSPYWSLCYAGKITASGGSPMVIAAISGGSSVALPEISKENETGQVMGDQLRLVAIAAGESY